MERALPGRTSGSDTAIEEYDEEARFWETHSPLDYPDDWAKVDQTQVDSTLGHILAVRLDAKAIEKLARMGRKVGVGPSSVARAWILERLAEPEQGERPDR